MERPKKPGTNQNVCRSVSAAITGDLAGDTAFGARAFRKGAPSRIGVGLWLSKAAGKAQGAAVYFGNTKSAVLLPCTTSVLCSTTFPDLKCAMGREVKFDDLTHCGADSRQLVFRPGCRSSLRPALSTAKDEAGFDRSGGTVTGQCAVLLHSCTCSATRQGRIFEASNLTRNTISWKGTVTNQ